MDLVSDMLSRIKNATLTKSRKVLVLKSKLILSIVEVLKKEGFINSYEECGETYVSENGIVNKYILIDLKYKGIKQKPYITNIKRISKPGYRVYSNYKSISKVLGGIGVSVLSTSRGVVTDRVARSEKLGGEILFTIF